MVTPNVRPGDAFELRDDAAREKDSRKHGAALVWRVQSVSSSSPWAMAILRGYRGERHVGTKGMRVHLLVEAYRKVGEPCDS